MSAGLLRYKHVKWTKQMLVRREHLYKLLYLWFCLTYESIIDLSFVCDLYIFSNSYF